MDNHLLPQVEEKIITLRNQQVILDCDVAELYGVATKEINQAVRNNPEKFPDGYIFELDSQEKGGGCVKSDAPFFLCKKSLDFGGSRL